MLNKIKNNKAYVVISFLVLSFLIFENVYAKCVFKVKAGSSIDIDEVMDCVEDRYGFDQDILRRSDKKASAPEVDIYFDKTNPKEGEVVTAVASPLNFRSVSENMYYSWYLVHSDESGEPIGDLKGAKLEASKNIAKGSFDYRLFGLDQDSDGEYDFSNRNIDDGDFYKPKFGGEFSNSELCFDHYFGYRNNHPEKTGIDFPVDCRHDFFGANYKFLVDDEEFFGLDPQNPDTDGDGVYDLADLYGLGQQKFTWVYKKGDMVGVSVEGVSNIPLEDDDSGRYKVMKAKPFPVADGDVFLTGDGCDRMGYNCYRVKKVVDKKEEIPDFKLSHIPKVPNAFSGEDFELTDWVSVNSALETEDFNSDYIYYDWAVFQCKGTNFDDCDISLGDKIDIKTYAKGLGEKTFIFRPKEELISSWSEKIYLKVILWGKRSGEDVRKTVSTEIVSFVKNPITISLHQTNFNKDSGVWSVGDEICKEGVSRWLCPVYKNQVLYAKMELPSEDGYWDNDGEINNAPMACAPSSSKKNCWTFKWLVDDEDYISPEECFFDSGESPNSMNTGCFDDKVRKGIFFVVDEGTSGEGSVTLLANRNRENVSDDLTAGRRYTVNGPLPVISNGNNSAAEKVMRINESGEEVYVDGKYEAFLEDNVSFSVSSKGILPSFWSSDWNYNEENDLLINQSDPSVKLVWSINGVFLTKDTKENESFKDLNIDYTTSPGDVSFDVKGYSGSNTILTATYFKSFDETYSLNLNKAWNVSGVSTISNQSDVVVSVAYNNEEEGIVGLKTFLASAVKNAPNYLVFIVKISVAWVFVVSLFIFSDKVIKNEN